MPPPNISTPSLLLESHLHALLESYTALSLTRTNTTIHSGTTSSAAAFSTAAASSCDDDHNDHNDDADADAHHRSTRSIPTCSITELHAEPTPLEFSRFVARNEPVVVRRRRGSRGERQDAEGGGGGGGGDSDGERDGDGDGNGLDMFEALLRNPEETVELVRRLMEMRDGNGNEDEDTVANTNATGQDSVANHRGSLRGETRSHKSHNNDDGTCRPGMKDDIPGDNHKIHKNRVKDVSHLPVDAATAPAAGIKSSKKKCRLVTVACTPDGRADGLLRVRKDMFMEGDLADSGVEGDGHGGDGNVCRDGDDDAVMPMLLEATGVPMLLLPHEEEMDFGKVLDFIIEQEKRSGRNAHRAGRGEAAQTPPIWGGEVRYLQSQNDNLRTTYAPLLPLLPSTIPWAAAALAPPPTTSSSSSGTTTTSAKTTTTPSSLSSPPPHPDAINIWLGNSLSTTSLHRDPYENIYVQITGRKHFLLLSPVCVVGLDERETDVGRWQRGSPVRLGPDGPDGRGAGEEPEPRSWRVDRVPEAGRVPVPRWDVDLPLPAPQTHTRTRKPTRVCTERHRGKEPPFEKYVTPMLVTLEPGDILYLPALWYHKVTQSCSPGGVCLAVNYWYDMDYSGPFYSTCEFLRGLALDLNEQRSREAGEG